MRLILTVLLFVAGINFVYANETANLYRTKLFTYGGIPICEKSNCPRHKILVNLGYAVGYSEDLKNPIWVVYRLGNRGKDFHKQKWERPDRFFIDIRTDARVSHDDIDKRFQRGHMAPNAAILYQYGQIAQLETYLMSNVVPQTKALNEGIWQELEKEIREKISQDDDRIERIHDVFVICGPIHLPGFKRQDSGVSIPQFFYKIIAYRKGYRGTVKAVAFKFPHKKKRSEYSNLMKYLTDVDEIEELTGLNFFSELSSRKQANLESVKRDFDFNELD